MPLIDDQTRARLCGRAMLGLVALAVVGCSAPPAGSEPPAGVQTLIGTVAIPIAGGGPASPPASVTQSCTGEGVLEDIHEGTEIYVRDGAGSTLQTGSLGPGEITPVGQEASCTFGFQIEDIPLGESFYTVQVADRAVRIYSADQLDAADWNIAISPVGAD